MRYSNPVIKGCFPDPSICKADSKYYLAASSFQFFPGVPLFESDDLVNWKLIGHALTRQSQLPLEGTNSCSGIFAPTLRYNEGKFYMVTTNTTTGGNFYVCTEDICGEWSEPRYVEQGGIDPSLYFENGRTYFMSNGTDDEGHSGIIQCEIDLETGKKLTPGRCIWNGCGGRFLESPHLYKINGTYYLMAAEGGTEYGHMCIIAKGESPYGPFESCPYNPILTNRNKGGYQLQGAGHCDLVEDDKGNWWMVNLAFRQIGMWTMHHVTGREVCLCPVEFDKDGWPRVGGNGECLMEFETDKLDAVQKKPEPVTFADRHQWVYLRNPFAENYEQTDSRLTLVPGAFGLEERKLSPTFKGIRQSGLKQYVSVDIDVTDCEGGISVYMTEDQHYDIAVKQTQEGFVLFRRLRVGDLCVEDNETALESGRLRLSVTADEYVYRISAEAQGRTYDLGSAQSKYLSTEIAGNFTGVVIGLFAQGEKGRGRAVFTDFISEDND